MAVVTSVIVILFVGLLGWLYAARGFFSAFTIMISTLVAGAVAFALWEPIAYAVIGSTSRGWLLDSVWGLSLAIPFALVLIVLRSLLDYTILKKNLDLDPITNIIGGLVCGVVASTIAAGVLLISIGNLRLDPGFLMYKPVDYAGGSVVKGQRLLYPADRITGFVYSRLSSTVYRPMNAEYTETLAGARPEVYLDGAMLRTNYNGDSKQTISNRDFRVTARYTVGKSERVQGGLIADTINQANQKVTDVSENPINPRYLEGFVVNFKSAATEKSGQIILGPSQVRLVAYNARTGDSIGLHPFAVASRAKPETNDEGQALPPKYGRWRYNAPNTFIASVGGENQTNMAFEFPVPEGYEAKYLYVKGVRVDVTEMPAGQDYKTPRERDDAILRGDIIAPGRDINAVDASKAVTFDQSTAEFDQRFVFPDNSFPFRVVLKKDNAGSLNYIEDGRNAFATSGNLTIPLEQANQRPRERSLQLRQFFNADGTAIVQINLGIQNDIFGLVSPHVQRTVTDQSDQPLVLFDVNGNSYVPIGFAYRDSNYFKMYFTPDQPFETLSDPRLEPLTRSRPDQEFMAIFRVESGAELQMLSIGDTAIVIFDETIPVRARR